MPKLNRYYSVWTLATALGYESVVVCFWALRMCLKKLILKSMWYLNVFVKEDDTADDEISLSNSHQMILVFISFRNTILIVSNNAKIRSVCKIFTWKDTRRN